MSSNGPPRLARWMLDHLVPGDRSEAMTGDLLECAHAGRGRLWFWRQTFSAMAMAWTRSVFDRRFMLLFAAAWAMLGPAWSLILTRLENDHNFGGFVWQLPWPWSTIADMLLSILLDVAFIWLGCLIYVLAFAPSYAYANPRRLARMFGASVAAYVLIWAVFFAVVLVNPPTQPHNFVDWRTLTLAGVITNIRVWPLTARLPVLVATAVSLWGVLRRAESRRRPSTNS